MAAKRFEKGSEEWNMFMDFWKLCQKYWEPDETEEYWESLAKDGFYEKYNTPFSRGLFWTLHKELERKLKEEEHG